MAAPPPMPNWTSEDADVHQRKTEREDPPEVIAQQVKKLAELIRSSRYFVAFTGAGISTAAGMPDFRGDNGLDKRGWQGAVFGLGVGESLLDTQMPTYAHMALVTLMNRGILKYIVSSNHDNFHIKSGIPREHVAEIFGNAYIETCLKCKQKFLRSVWVPQLNRVCDNINCGGRLKKEGVRFGALVPQEPLSRAYKAANSADFALVLGSSMTVSPFCEMPPLAKNGFVVVSLQPTAYDASAVMHIYGRCDDVMRRLLRELDIVGTADEPALGPFIYRQTFVLEHQTIQVGDPIGNCIPMRVKLFVKSDRKNEPITCLAEVHVDATGRSIELERLEDGSGAFEREVDVEFPRTDDFLEITFRIVPRPEYGEPPLVVVYRIPKVAPLGAPAPTGQQQVAFTKRVVFLQ